MSTGASLLGGDRLDVDLSVAAGRPPSAPRSGSAQGPLLVWDAEPLVLAEGAEVARDLDVAVGAGGRLLLRDTLVLGQSGEDGGSLTCRTHTSYDGRPALVETLDLDAGRLAPGVLGAHRVVDSAVALGVASGGHDRRHRVRPGEPGRLVRWLGDAAHASPILSRWRAWTITAAG